MNNLIFDSFLQLIDFYAPYAIREKKQLGPQREKGVTVAGGKTPLGKET